MSHKNYSKFSEHFNKNKEQNNTEIMDGQVTIDEVVNSETATEIIQEAESDNRTIIGVVTGCDKLNVRKEASTHSEVVCIIDKGSKVIPESLVLHNGFYKITTEYGAEGYCMAEYISIK